MSYSQLLFSCSLGGGVKFPASSMDEQELRAYRTIEKQNMQKLMDEYRQICGQMGVQILLYMCNCFTDLSTRIAAEFSVTVIFAVSSIISKSI